jgi:hypothetical protein
LRIRASRRNRLHLLHVEIRAYPYRYYQHKKSDSAFYGDPV